MSSSRINVDQLQDKLREVLADYSDEVNREVQSIVLKYGPKLTAKIKAGANMRTGAYKKSWKTYTEKDRLKTGTISYSDDRYMLPHLLEFEHPLRNGGRSTPNPHIQNAVDAIIPEVEAEIERIITK